MTGPAYFALPSVEKYGTVSSITATNINSLYPLSNSQGNDPADTTKSTSITTVISMVFPSDITPVAYMVANTNATSISLSNGAGMTAQAITIPSRTGDGQILNGWKNMIGVSSATDDVWTLTLPKSGSEVLEFGRVCIVTSLYNAGVIWGSGQGPKIGIERPGQVENVTRLGTVWRAQSGVQFRTFSGQVRRTTHLANFQALEALANGSGTGFMFIPDFQANEAWFARLTDQSRYAWQRQSEHVATFGLDIAELCMGAPPSQS